MKKLDFLTATIIITVNRSFLIFTGFEVKK